jgi:hypothetical protein
MAVAKARLIFEKNQSLARERNIAAAASRAAQEKTLRYGECR